MIKSLAVGAMVTFLAAPAFAAQSQPANWDRNTEVVCKTVSVNPGSRIGERKVCLTRAEWEARRQRDQDSLVHSQDNGLLATQP